MSTRLPEDGYDETAMWAEARANGAMTEEEYRWAEDNPLTASRAAELRERARQVRGEEPQQEDLSNVVSLDEYRGKQ